MTMEAILFVAPIVGALIGLYAFGSKSNKLKVRFAITLSVTCLITTFLIRLDVLEFQLAWLYSLAGVAVGAAWYAVGQVYNGRILPNLLALALLMSYAMWICIFW